MNITRVKWVLDIMLTCCILVLYAIWEKSSKGTDHLAKLTLKIFLTRLGYSLPEVVVYIEQFGDGAAIMRADISLWDRIRNPCAVIKMPQSNLGIPRSSIFHEVRPSNRKHYWIE